MDGFEIFPPGLHDRVKPKMASDIVRELLEAKVMDITDGFPANNAQEFWEIILQLSREGVGRIPIASVDGRVFMLFNPQRNEHQALFAALPGFYTVDFTTSIEGFALQQPVGEDYLELADVTSALADRTPPATVYLPLGKGTDIVMFDGKNVTATQFTPEGKDVLEKIFTAVAGVKFPRQSHGFGVQS